MSKCAIYARVSTSEQDPQNQVLVLKRWAESRAFDIVKVYEEAESAWKNGHQHQLAQLLEDARRRRFDFVLIWSLDRLSREGPLAILTLVHRLGRSGVKVLSHEESWTEAPGELGDLLFSLVAWVARFESSRKSERTKAGLARAVAAGKTLGRPPGAKDRRKRKKRCAPVPTWMYQAGI